MQARHPGHFGDDTFSILPENLNCLIVQFRLCDLIHMLAKQFYHVNTILMFSYFN